jgi:hypothetical protein
MVTREERGSLKSVTSSTIPCECRKALPPREGQASWWGLESIYSQDVRIPVGDESFEVSVSAEVPYDSANYRVQRRGNRYYPTLIDIECPDFMTLHACTARDLARALLAAAEAAEKIDDSDTDPRCGHWAPCECSESSQSVGAVARPDGITTG